MPQDGIAFSKYTGAGNDFVIVDAGESPVADPPALARRICPRASGVGVDGLVLVRATGGDLLRVRFFNPDGSEYSTCGNGSRCAARFALEGGLVEENPLRLRTDAGDVAARVDGSSVDLEYRLEAVLEREVPAELAGERRTGWLVQIGTPHLVVPVDRPEALEAMRDDEFHALCLPVRSQPSLGPRGANVDLVAVAGPDRLTIRSFERGVEGETLACGSGAMAAALVFHATGRCGRTVALRTRSGEILEVELLCVGPPPGVGPLPGGEALPARCDRMRLSGPARRLFDGTFPPEP